MNTFNKIDDVCNIAHKWTSSDRINWDEYYMCLAVITATRSTCSRLHVGCVLVKDNRVVSMGYNGYPTGEEHRSIIRTDVDGKPHEMATIHAEQNAICHGASSGISLKGATAYVTHYPCLTCAKLLVSCGISNIKYHEDYNNDPLVCQICTHAILQKI